MLRDNFLGLVLLLFGLALLLFNVCIGAGGLNIADVIEVFVCLLLFEHVVLQLFHDVLVALASILAGV